MFLCLWNLQRLSGVFLWAFGYHFHMSPKTPSSGSPPLSHSFLLSPSLIFQSSLPLHILFLCPSKATCEAPLCMCLLGLESISGPFSLRCSYTKQMGCQEGLLGFLPPSKWTHFFSPRLRMCDSELLLTL